MISRQCTRHARAVLWAVLLSCLLAGTAGARTLTESPRLAQPELPGWSVKELYELLTRDDS